VIKGKRDEGLPEFSLKGEGRTEKEDRSRLSVGKKKKLPLNTVLRQTKIKGG